MVNLGLGNVLFLICLIGICGGMISVLIKDKDGDIVEVCKFWRKYGYVYKFVIMSYLLVILFFFNFFVGWE